MSERTAAAAPSDQAWDELATFTVEGLTVPPLGTAAGAAGLPTAAALGADPGAPPFLRGARPTGSWDVREFVAEPDPAGARAAVRTAVGGGADSIWLRARNVAAALAGADPAAVPIVLDGGSCSDEEILAGAGALSTWAGSAALHPRGSLGADPIGCRVSAILGAASGAAGADVHAPRARGAAARIADAARDLGIGALVVDGRVAHDHGAGDALEIGYTLAVAAEYLRELTGAGFDVDSACRLIGFRYAVTDDQFVSIAKLRAARLVWHRVCELSGAAPAAGAQYQHAVTSGPMMTRYDPYVNMLRGTVAAFAAAVGGADALTVLPFDAAIGAPTEFSARIARNVSALLAGEASIGAVADPAGGAFAVEMLTARIAERAWAEFTAMEGAGGITAALAHRVLADRIAGIRAERDRRIATRRQPITGVSEFPNPAERPGDDAEGGSSATPARRRAPLSANARWSAPFEAMRDEPPRTPLLLLTLGSPGASSARNLFARNLLAAGGITIVERLVEPAAGSADDAPGARADVSADVAAAVTETSCHVVLLAGSDADYARWANEAAGAARSAGATHVFAAGRPAGITAATAAGLLDAAVALGDDVLAFLRTVRNALGAAR